MGLSPTDAKGMDVDGAEEAGSTGAGESGAEASQSQVTVDLFDQVTQDCPYDAYALLRDEAPVWQDPRTKMFVVTRYEDVRNILLDPERFRNARDRSKTDPRAEMLRGIYEEKGWVPAPTLAGRDDPNHREMRGLFNHAFRPQKIKTRSTGV